MSDVWQEYDDDAKPQGFDPLPVCADNVEVQQN